MEKSIGARTIPQIFIDKKYFGDCSSILKSYNNGELHKLLDLPRPSYDYKFALIGGGSGGVATAKRASTINPDDKTIIFDYVSPTPNKLHTKWGIGGTCVNVGCIPKKLYHRSAVISHAYQQSEFYKKNVEFKPQWNDLRAKINSYIKSLNFGTLADFNGRENLEYKNHYAKITAPHEITYGPDNQKITAKHIFLATGTRPLIPNNLKHLSEHLLTSDDIFWCPYEPGNTLVIGGGYVALECAAFLASFGYKVTVIEFSLRLPLRFPQPLESDAIKNEASTEALLAELTINLIAIFFYSRNSSSNWFIEFKQWSLVICFD
ncbi:MAG: thioredoxin reductase [Paramarteilia canceri]